MFWACMLAARRVSVWSHSSGSRNSGLDARAAPRGKLRAVFLIRPLKYTNGARALLWVRADAGRAAAAAAAASAVR